VCVCMYVCMCVCIGGEPEREDRGPVQESLVQWGAGVTETSDFVANRKECARTGPGRCRILEGAAHGHRQRYCSVSQTHTHTHTHVKV
jgi:hypothetical protein